MKDVDAIQVADVTLDADSAEDYSAAEILAVV
ncbi:MAG: hypothetical protein K0R72_1208 [Clostridia bacterium]|jgi:hypothetical protein|nr:hypothetical protein [Clostridia bacterium]